MHVVSEMNSLHINNGSHPAPLGWKSSYRQQGTFDTSDIIHRWVRCCHQLPGVLHRLAGRTCKGVGGEINGAQRRELSPFWR